jgi:Flp pilus assembly pilin Flp
MSDTTQTAVVHQPSGVRVSRSLTRLVRDQRGASFIEYVIVVGLVAIIAIAGFKAFGAKVVEKLTDETNGLDQVQPAGH